MQVTVAILTIKKIASADVLPYVADMYQNIYLTAQKLGDTLAQHGLTVTTAESCTGGGISQAITEIPGSSRWFSGAFVTYSNAMKAKLLRVSTESIAAHGAVSEEVVSQMLGSAIDITQSDLGVAVSGIAGPTGEVPGKPVGTVCFAVGLQSNIMTRTERFSGDRRQVREQTVLLALELLIECTDRL